MMSETEAAAAATLAETERDSVQKAVMRWVSWNDSVPESERAVPVIDRPVRLPRAIFLSAWEIACPGELPTCLGADDRYETDAQRAMSQGRAVTILGALGLADNDGNGPSRWLRDTFAIIAGADRELYALLSSQYGEYGTILVAAKGSEAVRVVTDDAAVHLDPIRADKLAERFVETLPDARAATLCGISVSRAEFDSASGFTDPAIEPSADRRAARRLREVLTSEREATHEMYAAARDARGRLRRSAAFTVLDLVRDGRVLTFVAAGENEAEMVNLVPGSAAELIHTLDATLADLG